MWFFKNPKSPFAFAGTIAARIVNAFKARVAADGGTFEAESCLNTTITNLRKIDLA